MGGDSDILPPRYVDNTFYPTNGYTSIPVDLYFACLDGSWNDTHDQFWGEGFYYVPLDNPDILRTVENDALFLKEVSSTFHGRDIFAPVANMSRPVGEWNHIEITMRGLACTVVLNGLKVLDADFSQMTEPISKFDFPYAKMAKTGYLGIQNHGKGTWWKNIQIKKLP